MAFTSNIEDRTVYGNHRVHQGTFTNTSGSTGGNIETGLSRIITLHLQPGGSSVTSNQAVVNETFPLSAGDPTIVTDADVDGTWIAHGT